MNVLTHGAHEAADWLRQQCTRIGERTALYAHPAGNLAAVSARSRRRPGFALAGTYEGTPGYLQALGDLIELRGELQQARAA